MIITNKKQMNNGVKSMAAKAMSWNQIAKQLSGISGYVTIDDNTKVRPLEMMQSLGVHVLKNSYTPKDLFMAWSERMKVNGKVCISRSVPFMVTIGGREFRLCTLKEGVYSGISQQALCPLVSATDKADKTDVVVNVTNVLRGLQQSVRVAETLDKIAKSAKKVAAISEGYVNIATKKGEEQYVPVVKGEDGQWSVKVAEKKVATEAQKAAKGGQKKGAKKGQKVA